MENSIITTQHQNPVDTTTITQPELQNAQPLINKSFGIIDSSTLSDGNKVLNTDYSAWTLAKKVNNGSTVRAFFTMIGDLFKRACGSANTLVGNAKSMQELLKNPVKATEAVKYLAELNLDKNVRLDLSQYRKNRLEDAAGTGDKASVNLAKAQSNEESYGTAMADIKELLGKKAPKELIINRYEGHQQSLEQLETAIREVSMLADSFDAQRQVVAALTYNIAQQAGIIDENGGVKDQARLDFLTDQMQSLWVKSAPSDKETPIAITKFADGIAKQFDPGKITSFDKMKSSVRNMALKFADSQITHKGKGKVDSKGAEISHQDQIVELAKKTEVQIWDALKANPEFTSKLTDQISKLQKQHTDLHDTSEVIEKVSKEVQDRFDALSNPATSTFSVGTLFSKQLHSLTGRKGETSMPHEMFGVLRELDKDSSTLEPTKALSLMGMGPSIPATTVLDKLFVKSSTPATTVFEKLFGTNTSVDLEQWSRSYFPGYKPAFEVRDTDTFKTEVLKPSRSTKSVDRTILDVICANVQGKAQTGQTIDVHKAVLDPRLSDTQRALLVSSLAENPKIKTDNNSGKDILDVICANVQRTAQTGQTIDVQKAVLDPRLTTAQRKQMVDILAQDPQTRANKGFNEETSDALLENLDVAKGTVNVEKAFTSLLSTSAVDFEAARIDKGSEEARKSIFSNFRDYASAGGVIEQYNGVVDFMRNKDLPAQRAVTLFDADSRQEGIKGMRTHLGALRKLVRQGTHDTAQGPSGKKWAEQLGFEKSIGLFKATDISDSEINQRYNLPMDKYYSMLSTAFGLDDANTTGDATAACEALDFLYQKDKSHELAAYLMMTEGKMSFEAFTALGQAHPEIAKMHAGLTQKLDSAAVEDPKRTELGKVKGEVVTFLDFNESELAALKKDVRIAQASFKDKLKEINAPLYMIDRGNIEGLRDAAKGNEENLALQIVKGLKLYKQETVGYRPFRKTQKTQMTQGTRDAIADITLDLKDLSDDSTKATAMQALKNKMQIAITPKAPIVIDKTVATNIANGSQDVVNANPVQQPAIPSLDANQLHAIVDGQNAAQELAKQALNKDTLTADDNGLVAQFGALVTRLGLIGTDQAQVLADINKLIADTRAA